MTSSVLLITNHGSKVGHERAQNMHGRKKHQKKIIYF